MVVGGMYNVLEIAVKFLTDYQETYFTKAQIKELTGLSDQAVTNNVCRLEKAGFLIREEYVVGGKHGRCTRYKLSCGNINEFMDVYFS